MHAASRTTGQNAGERASRFFCKVVRETGDYDEVVRFGDFASRRVVLFNVFELAAKIRLEDALHMFGDLLQAVSNLNGFCPDAMTNQLFVKIGQMHHGRETLPKSNRINQRELHSARSDVCEQTKQNGSDKIQCGLTTSSVMFNKN